MKQSRRPALLIVGAIAGLVVAVAGAVPLLETVRGTDVVMIVAGSFGSGASLVAAVHQYRGRGR